MANLTRLITFGRSTPLVLHADDDPESLEFVKMCLKPMPVRLAGAADGASALRLALSRIPALVLLDVVMPGLDGIRVCHELRRSRHGSRFLIYMVTALDTMKDMEKALAWGANGYLTKPIDAGRLSRLVAKLLVPSGKAAPTSR